MEVIHEGAALFIHRDCEMKVIERICGTVYKEQVGEGAITLPKTYDLKIVVSALLTCFPVSFGYRVYRILNKWHF